MPLSVGVFTYSSKPRGSVVCAAALAEALGDLGHDAVLYALDKDGSGFFRHVRCKLRLIPAHPAPDDPEALVRQRVDEVSEFMKSRMHEHDILHAQDCLVASGLLQAGAGAPVVRTVHHLEAFDNPYLAACQTRSIRRAAALVSVSWTTHRSVQEAFALDSSVIENGVKATRFAVPPPEGTASFRARFGIPRGSPMLLSVGGVEPRKNTLQMLLGFSAFAKRHPRAHWLIVGGASIWDHADYRQAFQAELAALPPKTRRRIHLGGVLSEQDLNFAYYTAEVLLNASTLEGWGLSTLEAMASGTSVVVSQGMPFDEYLDPVCATFVDPNSVPSISEGLERAYRRRVAIAEAAIARARRYSWLRSAERHAELYAALLAERAGTERADAAHDSTSARQAVS